MRCQSLPFSFEPRTCKSDSQILFDKKTEVQNETGSVNESAHYLFCYHLTGLPTAVLEYREVALGISKAERIQRFSEWIQEILDSTPWSTLPKNSFWFYYFSFRTNNFDRNEKQVPRVSSDKAKWAKALITTSIAINSTIKQIREIDSSLASLASNQKYSAIYLVAFTCLSFLDFWWAHYFSLDFQPYQPPGLIWKSIATETRSDCVRRY